MKRLTILTAITCTTLLITSCNKGKIQGGNGEKLKSFFSDNVTSNTQHFTINANTGGTFVGEKGTRVTISPNSLFDASGQIVTGTVNIELIEIYDRASMLMMNKPTMGQLPDGKKSVLISGGEYYLKISQNGVELNSTGVDVTMPTGNTGGPDFNMSLFDGTIENNDLTWNLLEDTVNVDQDTTAEFGSSYEILDGSWGWTNVDRFYSDPRPKTTLKLKVPDGFDNTNCEVYLTYDGEPTALASLDTYTSDGYFSEHYGQIPIGLEVHFIAVTMINDELNYAVLGATITDGYIGYINSFSPISQANLATMINNLP